jgi:hypothetical protein
VTNVTQRPDIEKVKYEIAQEFGLSQRKEKEENYGKAALNNELTKKNKNDKVK